FNPSIRRTILQTMDILREEEDLLGRLGEQAMPPRPETPADHLALPLSSLKACHQAIRRRVIEQGCWAMAVRPTFRQIGLVLSLLTREDAGGEVHLGGGLRIEKTNDALLFHYPRGKNAFRGSGREAVAVAMEITAPGEYRIPSLGALLQLSMKKPPASLRDTPGLVVDADRISFPLRLQSIVPGQRFHPFGGKGSKKINRFLNDRGIPSSQRDFFLVLSMRDEVVALPGLTIDDRFRVTSNTRKAMVIDWRIPGRKIQSEKR
ncbi:MAG: tRNA lysidine(34) synthetase TilS, partial [Desulfobulbaceae bacterium]